MSVKKVLISVHLVKAGVLFAVCPTIDFLCLVGKSGFVKMVLSPVVDHCKLETKGVGDHHRPDIKERMTTVLAADDMYCVTCCW